MTLSLREIYQRLRELPLSDVIYGKMKEDSLILSLEFLIKCLNETDEKTVELFYLIGLNPDGLDMMDMNRFYSEDVSSRL